MVIIGTTQGKGRMAAAAGFLRMSLHSARMAWRALHGGAQFDKIPAGLSPVEAYQHLVSLGDIHFDQGQLLAMQPLERIHRQLKDYHASPPSPLLSKFSSFFGAFLPRKEAPQGVYFYGGVGSGKSLVVDIFYHCSPIQAKRRVHFHQFMLDVHKRLHEKRLQGWQGSGDAIESLAQDLLETGWLLCFDEFQVIDIADAMILRRLLECLFKGGAVMVSSSNRSPYELYKNGLQRELFLPCIDLINKKCEVYSFHQNSPDYRLIGARPQGSSVVSVVWHTPLNQITSNLLEEAFTQLSGERLVGPTIIKEGSRTILVPRAAGGIAYFTFQEICGTPKGASDYLAIAFSFHTIFISGIHKMTDMHNEMARRFITLVDVLYEQRVKLIVSAEVEPKDLYQPRAENHLGQSSGKEKGNHVRVINVEKDEEFAFARAVSRLMHMQSSDYLSSAWASPGKAFIGHLEKTRLKEGDLHRIWDRYNTDSDSRLSRTELLLMMEDLTEIKAGHRNVPEELVNDMYRKLDANGDGDIVWTEFRDYFLQYGLEIQS